MDSIAIRVASFPVASETFIVNHIKLILQLGYEVEVVVNHLNGLEVTSQREIIAEYDLQSKVVLLPSVSGVSKLSRFSKVAKGIFSIKSIRPIGLFNPFLLGWRALLGGYFVDYLNFKEILKSKVVHVHFGDMITSIDAIKKLKLLDFKLIVTFYGYDAHFTNANLKDKRKFYSTAFEVGDWFTCLTPYLEDQLVLLGCPKDKLEVIHLPINADYFSPFSHEISSGKGCFYLISIGRLIGWKGHRYGLQVVERLVLAGYDVHYNIIGEGPEKDSLLKEIKERNLDKHVSLLGRKSQQDILDYLRRSDIFLMTSVEDANGRTETQGVVSGEAQACGVPVVGFKAGGVPYSLIDGETGFLCEQGNVEEMTQRVRELLDDELLLRKMSERGVQFIREIFSEEVAKSKWQKVYNRFLIEESR